MPPRGPVRRRGFDGAKQSDVTTLGLPIPQQVLENKPDIPAKLLEAFNNIVLDGYVEWEEIAEPDTPDTGALRVFAFDNAGTQELRVKFANGIVKTLADDI